MKYVYMVRAGNQQYKVGIASNVGDRVKALQTSNPLLLELVMCRLVEDANTVELAMHRMLEESRLNGGREWFELTSEQALDLCVLINKYPTVDMSKQITVREIMKRQIEIEREILKQINNLTVYTATKEHVFDKPSKVNKIFEQPKERQVITDNEYIEKAKEVFKKHNKASTSLLQRQLQIGYGKAARILDLMEQEGLVAEADGARARDILY
jgi:ribosomal protein S25